MGEKKETIIHREKCTDFNTSLHSSLEEAFAIYNSYGDKIERNECVSVRKARKALKEIMNLCVLRRRELLDNYRWQKDKKENEI